MGETKLGNKHARQSANCINDKMPTVNQEKRGMPNRNIKLDCEIWWQATFWFAECHSR